MSWEATFYDGGGEIRDWVETASYHETVIRAAARWVGETSLAEFAALTEGEEQQAIDLELPDGRLVIEWR